MQKLSIIIPTLNEAEHIQQTLNYLQALRRKGHEVIVVDGGSIDNTVTIAASLSNTVIQTKAGRALQMNAGADNASGDVLLFLHADTELPRDADRGVLKQFRQGQDSWGRFDVTFDVDYWPYSFIAFCMNWRSRITGIATGDQSIFVARPLFKSVGGYPEQPLMEDIELSRRLRKSRRPICLPSKVVTSSRRWRKHGIIRTILLMWYLRLAYFFGVDASRLAARYSNK